MHEETHEYADDRLHEARLLIETLEGELSKCKAVIGAIRRALCLHIDKPDSDVIGEVARYIACAAQGERDKARLVEVETRLAVGEEASRDARDYLANALDDMRAQGQLSDIESLVEQAHQRLELLGLGDGDPGRTAEQVASVDGQEEEG